MWPFGSSDGGCSGHHFEERGPHRYEDQEYRIRSVHTYNDNHQIDGYAFIAQVTVTLKCVHDGCGEASTEWRTVTDRKDTRADAAQALADHIAEDDES